MKEQTLRQQISYWEGQYHEFKTNPSVKMTRCADMALMIIQEKRKQLAEIESQNNSFLNRLAVSLRKLTLTHGELYLVNDAIWLWWDEDKNSFVFRNNVPFEQDVYKIKPFYAVEGHELYAMAHDLVT
jgi:hypothetical protein